MASLIIGNQRKVFFFDFFRPKASSTCLPKEAEEKSKTEGPPFPRCLVGRQDRVEHKVGSARRLHEWSTGRPPSHPLFVWLPRLLFPPHLVAVVRGSSIALCANCKLSLL